MTNNTFAFYEKTLVESNFQKQLIISPGSVNISQSIIAFDMDLGSVKDSYILYGAGPGQIFRYDIYLD